VKIALVEDDVQVYDTFASLLGRVPGHALVGTFGSAEEALAGLQPGMADLLVADLDLPGRSGIELIARVQEPPLALQAVVWTVYDGADSVYAAIRAGAIGYLLKSMSRRELQGALKEIEEGGAPISPRIARRLLRDLATPGPTAEPDAVGGPHELSVRERAVLRMIADGHCRKEIAESLGVSINTVHSHVKRVYRKLHVTGRNDAIHRARQLGILAGR